MLSDIINVINVKGLINLSLNYALKVNDKNSIIRKIKESTLMFFSSSLSIIQCQKRVFYFYLFIFFKSVAQKTLDAIKSSIF